MDLGKRRIGIAASDPLGITAQPVETYRRKGLEADIAHLVELFRQKEAALIVCGLPLNMNGSYGPQAEETREFAQALQEACGLPLEFVDERLTSAMAQRSLIESGMRREKRKDVIDQLAAVHILQTYLDKTRTVRQGEQGEQGK